MRSRRIVAATRRMGWLHLAARGESPAAFDRPCIPAELRCSSVTYAEYAPSSRLVSRAPDRSRCDAGFHHRLLAAAGVIGLLLAPGAATGQTADAEAAPRTPWGAPDLAGVWDFRSLTPFERPVELADKALLTDEDQALVLEDAEETWRGIQDGNDQMPTGSYNEAWYDVEGVGEDRRTALIVDPPSGRMPPLTAGEQRRQAEQARVRRGLGLHELTYGGWVADMGPGHLAVRCLVGFNSGPPMTPSAYNNNMQLFQTEDHIVVLNEMVHSARVIPLGGQTRLAAGIRQQMGDSRGRWEGDTLVVETQNFLRGTGFQGGQTGRHLRLEERFTRVGPETLQYEATVDDPTVWTTPWTFQLLMNRNDQPLYEYACHEGNYGIYNILTGAREAEAALEAAGAGAP